MTSRYVVIHHGLAPRSVSWIVIDLETDSVVVVCPNRPAAAAAAFSLNQPTNQGAQTQ